MRKVKVVRANCSDTIKHNEYHTPKYGVSVLLIMLKKRNVHGYV